MIGNKNDTQAFQDKLKEMKSRMSSRTMESQAATEAAQRQEYQEQQRIEQEQMMAVQAELEQIEKLQNNGVYRLANLNSQLKELDISIEFGSKLFERLDILNVTLEKIASSLISTKTTTKKEAKKVNDEEPETEEFDEDEIPDDALDEE